MNGMVGPIGTFLPNWTDEQQATVIRKYEQNPDGAENILDFAGRFRNYGDYIGGIWCGMFLGIEKDGYAHT